MDDKEDAAYEELKTAIESFLKIIHHDESIILVGVVLSASGSGVQAGEILSTFHCGATTERLGLLSMLTYRVEEVIFGGNEG